MLNIVKSSFVVFLVLLFSCDKNQRKNDNRIQSIKHKKPQLKYNLSYLNKLIIESNCCPEEQIRLAGVGFDAELRSYELAMQAVEQKNIALYNALIESYRAGESYGLGLMLADMMIYKYGHPKAYYDRAVLQYEGSRNYGTEKKLTQDILYNLKKAKQNGYKWHKIFELPDKQKVSYSDIN